MSNNNHFFKSVTAFPEYKLKVEMGTGACIYFDFKARLNSVRFCALKEVALFNTVHTDGSYLLFELQKYKKIKITAKEFMDMVMVDRTIEI